MNVVFADSFFFIALLNPNDPAHAKALAFTKTYRGRLLTTGWVVTELGDGCSKPARWRQAFVDLYKDIRANSNIGIEPCADAILDEGINLYSQRPDKEWTLTDCISFVVMQREGVTEALTGDHHFEQAGFVALLK
jgi:predicted nucleic acid-binding protein